MDCPRPTEGDGDGALACTGVGETSVACGVGGGPNEPAGTIGVDVDVEVPRDDGVVGRLGTGAVADADGEEAEGGGKNGDRARRPRGARTGEGDDSCCLDGE
jgi:hypothetical protein